VRAPALTVVEIPLKAMLADTQVAFDSVAAIYDGPRGNNTLMQRMRALSWRLIAAQIPTPARLLDIGCGTGIDALHFARQGYSVLATDWSGQMVARAAARAAGTRAGSLTVAPLGAHELHRLGAAHDAAFDGIYSNFGALNCVPDLGAVSRECARLLRTRGLMLFTVIGRLCPWELAYYLLQLRLRRALVRFAPAMTPVRLNTHTVWSRYYTPREFYRHFAPHFELVSRRALSLFLPPPYLLQLYESLPRAGRALARLDDTLGTWPLLRDGGDHFLMILRKR
jgi:SAM-dependent methyltransferase